MPRKSDGRTVNEIITSIINEITDSKIFDNDSDVSEFSLKDLSSGIDEVISIKLELGKLQKRMQLDLKEQIEKGDNQNETAVKDVRLSHKSSIRIVK